MSKIKDISALEILDSRGFPTVQASVWLTDDVLGVASVPSGASTGSAEALELRDGERHRYSGRGCRRAVSNIEAEMRSALVGKQYDFVFDLDRDMIEIDGTKDKSRLGANAVLAVSLAFAKAQAQVDQQPLHTYLARPLDHRPAKMPQLTVNLFSGGLHAGGVVPIQDCLIVPSGAATVSEGLEWVHAVYQAGARLIRSRYGSRLLTADEGGMAPDYRNSTEMLDLAVAAIKDADKELGADVSLALDVAATHFFKDGQYLLDGQALDSDGMIGVLRAWIGTYPILSIEDGLAEEDWDGWHRLQSSLGAEIHVMGDDLLCTQPVRIRKAVERQAANALLLKVNQVGTLYEAHQALNLARDAGWSVTISARSGETEDNWLADLAVGWGADFIKIGSITQSERLAKYNRLLQIERDTGWRIKQSS